jgi:hypothetical protein
LNIRAEIARLELGFALFYHVPHPADDLARATVFRRDVPENLTHLAQFRRIVIEKPLGGLGVAEDRSQGLLQFMRQ